MEQPASPQPFEVSLDRLEKIVKELESGSPPLEPHRNPGAARGG
jgi:exonuclease VII small subunit